MLWMYSCEQDSQWFLTTEQMIYQSGWVTKTYKQMYNYKMCQVLWKKELNTMKQKALKLKEEYQESLSEPSI